MQFHAIILTLTENMNYDKIYTDLIKHRKMLPKIEGVYYEKHHIVPRCLGGNNKKDNLIYLTASDHFVAHLLLAKIHGGKLWFAAQAMSFMSDKRKIKHRRSFETIRKQCGIQSKGCRDKTEFLVMNERTGKTYNCNKDYMISVLGLSNTDATKLIKGRRRMIKGFTIPSNYKKDIEQEEPEYEFIKMNTGEIILTTVKNMAKITGLFPFGFNDIVKKKKKSYMGYSIVGVDHTRHNEDTNSYLIEFDGVRYKIARKEFMTKFGLRHQDATALIKGRCKTSKGVKIILICTEDNIPA